MTVCTASGFGLGVATALVKRGEWNVHLFDRNAPAGEAVSSSLGTAATFHAVDVADYRSLSEAFHNTFTTEGRIDFVFANAGISEMAAFYDQHPAGQIPPDPNLTTVDVDFKSVCTTSYLALHYFRQSPAGDKALVSTASSAGLYSSAILPTYSGAKSAVIAFTRSIAKGLVKEGIRCNAICPAGFRTGLVDNETWDRIFAPDVLGDISSVVNRVLQLVDGKEMIDAVNNRVAEGEINGLIVEIVLDQFYFREPPIFSNPVMAKTAGVRDLDKVKYML